MKICTTYGSSSDYDDDDVGCREYRLDTFDELPPTDENCIITLCGKDISLVPKDFKGLVDVGDQDITCQFKKMVSYHDFERTPSSDEIVRMLNSKDADVRKGAFSVRSFADLMSILEASRSMTGRYVILGMGETGTITRLRQSLLGNEFTFGYSGKPTAPGQLSVDDMEALGDDCIITGITGHPLGHTLSPPMQNSAIMKAGINATYIKFPSETVDRLAEAMIAYDIRGMNVTIPHKSDVMEQLDHITETAESIGAVNVIVNNKGKLTGTNTDARGIDFSFRDNVPDAGSKVLVLGSGGAARASVYAMCRMNCEVTVSGRNAKTVGELAKDFSITGTNTANASDFDIIMNCTPIGMEKGGIYPAKLDLNERHVVFDAVYNRETPIMEAARKVGATVLSGKDMLIGQGAEAFELWFGVEACTESMRRAIE